MDSKKPWAGRFSGGPDPEAESFTASVSFDRRLWSQDLAGSRAHARMLARQGLLTGDERDAILDGLDRIQAEIAAGTFPWRVELEDVHMNVERRLQELVGEPAGKLHTGRSRNDQVALDFRLHVSERLAAWQALARGLVEALAHRAREHAGALLPGYTHMQPAQPVSLGHHLLAYCWMLMRDCERMAQCDGRTRVSPLGAAALAGTTFPLDPGSVARELGLEGVFANSLDAVSDRDFVLEALSAAALAMTHLSRLAGEIVLWANPGFGFVRLPDGYSTGSSIMPQKRNPDVAELVRGKAGRVYGSLMGLLSVVKGLPLAYNSDLQEDKEAFFDADDTLSASLRVMAGMVRALEFDRIAMRLALDRGFVNATELADYLAAKGMPFRQAHEVAGRAVALAESRGQGLEDLSLDELQALSGLIEKDVYHALSHVAAVERRATPGGTGPDSVAAQLDAVRAWLADVPR